MSPRAAMTLWPASPSISASARLPRSSRLSPAFGDCCVIFFHPLFHAGISGNLGVEDEKAGLQFGHMGADTLAVLFKQRTALRFRANAALPQGRVAQHFPNRHPGRFEAVEKFYPDQD